MTTTCAECGAALHTRAHINLVLDPSLFAETYKCGAVRIYGLVDGDGTPRVCPRKEKQDEHTSTG